MKTLLQIGNNERKLAPPEKRFLINVSEEKGAIESPLFKDGLNLTLKIRPCDGAKG